MEHQWSQYSLRGAGSTSRRPSFHCSIIPSGAQAIPYGPGGGGQLWAKRTKRPKHRNFLFGGHGWTRITRILKVRKNQISVEICVLNVSRLGISILYWNHVVFNDTGFMPPTWNVGLRLVGPTARRESWNNGQKRITSVFGSRFFRSMVCLSHEPYYFSTRWNTDGPNIPSFHCSIIPIARPCR